MVRKLTGIAMLMVAPTLVFAQRAQRAPQPAAPAQATPAAPAGPAPVIDVQEKIKDFGTVPKGEKISAVFTVTNTGKAPLEINQVRPTCGCTVASFDKTIPPGGSGKVTAEVDTTNFSGPISKAVLVFSNDPTTPQVNLVIKADVHSFIEVRPRPIVRFNALQGEASTEKVTLVSSDGTNFKVTGVDTAGGPYKVEYKELGEKDRMPDAKGSQWEVAITVPADAPDGILNHRLEVKTTAEKAPTVPVSVTGVVRPIIQVIPAEISFGAVPGDAPVGRNLILINNRQGATLDVKADVDNADFKTEVIPLEAGQRFQVAVSIPAGLAKGDHKATLTITTNDPGRPSIKVPVSAVVQ